MKNWEDNIRETSFKKIIDLQKKELYLQKT